MQVTRECFALGPCSCLAFVIRYRDSGQNIRYHFALLGCVQLTETVKTVSWPKPKRYSETIHHENIPIKFWPLKPHFYIVKLGVAGYTLFFLFLLKNIDCGYSLESPRRGCSNEYTQSMFRAEIWKNIRFYLKTFSFWWSNFQNIWIGVFS